MSERGEGRQLHRIAAHHRRPVPLIVDGEELEALEGDTVLSAILTRRRSLRRFEFGSEGRAGFCLMGICQECWLQRMDGEPIRACTTLVGPGLQLMTNGR